LQVWRRRVPGGAEKMEPVWLVRCIEFGLGEVSVDFEAVLAFGPEVY
jgi:hypothetical protein